jgi:hypothetical protein
MTNPIIKLVNATTGEEIEREMNAEELAEWNAVIAEKEALAAETATKAADKAAAQAKLAALGLTSDDLKALGLGNN